MSLLADTFYLGANAKVQAIRFALCLALGLAAGIIALLYLRKARPVERALTDFFATVCIGGLFIVCLEFFLDGKFELYGLAAFILGIVPIPLITRKLLLRKQASHPSGDKTQTSKNETRPTHSSTDDRQTSEYKNSSSRVENYSAVDNDEPYEYEAVAYEKPEDENYLK